MTPATSKAIQDAIDAENAGGIKIAYVAVHNADGSIETVTATPLPKPIPIADLGHMQPGKNYDLGGKTVTLPASIVVPVGAPITVHNGTINFSGGHGATGDGSMACFQVRTGATIILLDLRFNIPANHAVVRADGGSAKCTNIVQSAGAIFWGSGFDRCEIANCYAENPPEKYWWCNFNHRGNILRGDNTACSHPILQGIHEAAIRIMQVDDLEMVGFVTKGSGVKQDVQDRPAGQPGDVFKQHIWRGCKFDRVDCGNFKDKTDVHFPFGILRLSRWENCIIGHFANTAQGANPIGKAMGIDRIEQVNCTIGGKHVASNVITR
jgi:hypothetical protein